MAKRNKINPRIVAAMKKSFPAKKAKTRKPIGKPKRVSLTDHLLTQILAELKQITSELRRLNDQVAFEPGKLDTTKPEPLATPPPAEADFD